MNSLSIQSLLNDATDRIICHSANGPIRLQTLKNNVSYLSQQLALSSHQHWVLASDSSFNFLCGFLALLVAGKEIFLPPNNLAGTINETLVGVDALLTDLDLETYLHKTKITHAESNYLAQAMSIDENKLFIQICTSGSTGEPKQIRKSLATLENEVNALEGLWGELTADKVFISTVSHQHIYGLLFRIFWPLLSGKPFVNENIEYPEQIEAMSIKYGEMVLISSPAYLKRMADVLDKDCVSKFIGVIYSSGGPLARETSTLYRMQFGITPMEVLGSTESGGIAYRQQHPDKEVLWKKFSQVEIRREQDSGALSIRSPFCFSSDWYEMGDSVELVDNDHFRLLGRIDRIVKLEEKRISLDRMESELAKNELVAQVRILVLEGYRTILGAVCILTDAGQAKLAEIGRRGLSNQLKEYLSVYFDRVTLPRKWRYVADFPYNTQGKITQAALSELFEENNEDGEGNGGD
jgi:acyl-coenzyme A synthetase/AMP-(fatty) acid ligase